eukprot:g32470.t1
MTPARGTYSLGLPPDLKLPSPPSSPRDGRRVSSPFLAEFGRSPVPTLSPAAFLQHERLLTGLLIFELVVEIAYISLLCHASRHSIHEVALAYEVIPLESLWSLFWVQLAVQMGYLKLYFCVAFSAVSKHKPRLYGWFSNVALGGIIIQVLFSYMNKSNIFVFSLRRQNALSVIPECRDEEEEAMRGTTWSKKITLSEAGRGTTISSRNTQNEAARGSTVSGMETEAVRGSTRSNMEAGPATGDKTRAFRSLHAPGEAHPFAIAEEEIEHYGADAGEIVLEGEEPG